VRRRAPLVAAIIAVVAAGCAPSSLVQRERVFDLSTFAGVDALTLALLPRRVRNCGVQSEPRVTCPRWLFVVDLLKEQLPNRWPAISENL